MPDGTAPVAHQRKEAFGQAVCHFVVDNGSHKWRWVAERFVDDKPIGQFFQLGYEHIIHVVPNNQAPRRCAALTGRQERRLHHKYRGAEQIACVPDNDGVITAHFQGKDFVGPCCKLPVKRDAGLRRTSEQQAIYIGMH